MRLKLLLGATGDKQADKAIEKAYDVVRSSPMRTTSSASQYELDLLDGIRELGLATQSGNVGSEKRCAAQRRCSALSMSAIRGCA